MKRVFDIVFSLAVLLATSPVVLTALLAVWIYDRHSPVYRAVRVGIGNSDFRMMKIRSMRIDADRIGGTSTAATDDRITPVGKYIRRWKLDELLQFWNVLTGDMSVVGPRPNTRAGGVDHYTDAEMRILSVRPGITDLSSIVFSDEGDILAGSGDPDALYDRIIRPWKSRMGLLYAEQRNLALDLRLAWLTAVAMIDRRRALDGVRDILVDLGADPKLVLVAERKQPLPAALPPGASTA